MKILGNLMIIAGLVLLLANIAYAPGSSNSASSVADSYYADCALNVTLVNQNPYPAQPDSYVDVVFQVNWMQNYVCNGSRFEMLMSYPFSLDGNASGLRTLPDDTYIQDYKKDWMVPYHLRVDKDALDGESDVEVQLSPGIWSNSTPMIRHFNITIQDARTAFDAVMQDITGSQVSIAIANAGKYTANSVVVRIPDQQDFSTTGTSGQMVGNLASGDYTVVGFTITPKLAQPAGFRNASSPRNFGNESFGPVSKNLKFDVYYTDNIGIRRVANMELPYAISSSGNFTRLRNSSAAGNFQGAGRTNGTSAFGSGTLLIIGIVCIIVVFLVYMKFFRRKAEKHHQEKGETPDWVRNAKSKK